MIHNITGVILAGGASKRFDGVVKAKIVIGNRTIISRITEIMSGIFNEIIIVTNTPGEFKEYAEYKIIQDRFLNRGPLGGIHSALMESSGEAIFVVAGDMPLLDAGLITRQIEFFGKNECDILIPAINQNIEPLHGIYKRSLLGILEEHLQENINFSVRELFKKTNVLYFYPGDTEKTRNAFININSPSDISLVKKHLL